MTSTCRGRRPSFPSASGRSTSTACIRIWGSSSRSSWRRSSALRKAGRSRARPVRRVGDDARAVPGVRLRRRRRRRRRVQLSAHAGEDDPLRPVPAGRRDARRSRAARAVPRPPARVRPRLVRSTRGCRSPPLPLRRRGLRARRRPACGARPRGAVGEAHHALRSRLPTRSPARPVLVPQAPPRVCAGTGGGEFLSRYVLDTLERIKAFQKVRARGRAAIVVHGDSTEVLSTAGSTRS